MPQPGMPSASGEDWMVRRLQDLERKVQQMEAANVFGRTGITPKDGGTDFDGYVNVNGPMSITGALNLPAGIIGNDALANPLVVKTSNNYLNNYAVGTTSTARASVTLVVPEGFTSAIIMANATGMAQNSTAGADYLYVQAVVNGVNGGEMYTSAGAGLAVGISSPFNTAIYGLTAGQQVTVAVATRTGFGTWAASTANQANIYATVLYFR